MKLNLSKLMQVIVAIAICLFAHQTHAQNVNAPNFWDPNVRYVKPNGAALPRMRFLTTTDFAPFNFIDRKKRLSGFNIDLARAICVELEVLQRCQIQALPWSELEGAIEKDEGEAIIAGIAVTPQKRKKLDFTQSYLKIPGRFISRRDSGIVEPIYKNLFKKTAGVVAGSSHQKYFGSAFSQRRMLAFPTRQAAFNALKKGTVDTVFTDALSATFWLSSDDANDCCTFAGRAYMSDRFFGTGLSIAVKRGNDELLSGLNYALKRINDNGKFLELYLKYFPQGLY